MLRMIVRSDRIVNELGDWGRARTCVNFHSHGDQGTVLNMPLHYHLHKLFEIEVIQTANCSVIVVMLNDKQCFRLVGFMVAVITTFASTCFTIINTVN